MAPEAQTATDGQRAVAAHDAGPLLVRGEAGSGRTEALALRLEALAQRGVRPEHVLVLARSRAARARLRDRAEILLDRPHEELWIRTYEEAAEELLREYSTEAGLDPFFTTVAPRRPPRDPARPPRRPAAAPPRDPRQPRRAARAAAAPDRPPEDRGGRRRRRCATGRWRAERAATTAAERERAEREIEFADLFARHDRILREAGSLDGGDLVLELGKLLANRADVAAEVGERFVHVLADELEDAGAAHRAVLEAVGAHGNIVCAGDPAQATRRFRGAGEAAIEAFLAAHPDAAEIDLGASLRAPAVTRFWRCENDRAQAQAVAREIEHLLAAGEVRAERICVIAGSGWREGRLVAAALEERSVPFRFAGDAAFFQRPEVRDVLAWLRMLADPGDAAAVVRSLTRPPAELRSVDLAKVTTIARRRKLDMISALEAALESPQLPPEARDRIQTFLRLHRAASNALEGMRADVFVRRLIERVGLRRHRLFAASPETAERLVNLSHLAELAADWSRREPRGSVRDFVRHLSAVAEAGERPGRRRGPADPGRGDGRRAGAGQGPRVRPRLPARAAQRRGRLAAVGGRLDPRAAARRAAARARRRAHRGAPADARPRRDHPCPAGARDVLAGQARAGADRAIAHLPGGARGARCRRGAPRGGAVRAGRGAALHLPDAARRGPRGLVEGGLGDLRDAPRHRRGRQRARSLATSS